MTAFSATCLIIWAAVYVFGLVLFVKRAGRGQGFFPAVTRRLGSEETSLRTLRLLLVLWLLAGPFVLIWVRAKT
jgi:hypothetical protein